MQLFMENVYFVAKLVKGQRKFTRVRSKADLRMDTATRTTTSKATAKLTSCHPATAIVNPAASQQQPTTTCSSK